MSDLKDSEKLKFEKLLVQNGYVLDFSDRTFRDFFIEHTNIDIYDEKYNYKSGSKANRLRAFWIENDNYVVGKIGIVLLERWKAWKLDANSEITSSEQILYEQCCQIAQNFMQAGTGGQEIDEVAITTVHFEQIQQKIVEQIKLAQFVIWVAVAWFTDRKLFDLLVAKKKQGVNVQIIVIDDETNKNSGLPYEEHFETYRIKKSG